MKRNWYAAIILLALCVLLFRAGQYVDRTTAGMQWQLEAAYALAEQGDYPAARHAYSRAANRALRSTQVLGLLVRRNILDQLNQTLAVLPPCAEADSLAAVSYTHLDVYKRQGLLPASGTGPAGTLLPGAFTTLCCSRLKKPSC